MFYKMVVIFRLYKVIIIVIIIILVVIVVVVVPAQWGLRLGSGVKSVHYGYKCIQLEKRWLAQTGFLVANRGSPSCMPIQEESCNRFTLQVICGSEFKT